MRNNPKYRIDYRSRYGNRYDYSDGELQDAINVAVRGILRHKIKPTNVVIKRYCFTCKQPTGKRLYFIPAKRVREIISNSVDRRNPDV